MTICLLISIAGFYAEPSCDTKHVICDHNAITVVIVIASKNDLEYSYSDQLPSGFVLRHIKIIETDLLKATSFLHTNICRV